MSCLDVCVCACWWLSTCVKGCMSVCGVNVWACVCVHVCVTHLLSVCVCVFHRLSSCMCACVGNYFSPRACVFFCLRVISSVCERVCDYATRFCVRAQVSLSVRVIVLRFVCLQFSVFVCVCRSRSLHLRETNYVPKKITRSDAGGNSHETMCLLDSTKLREIFKQLDHVSEYFRRPEFVNRINARSFTLHRNFSDTIPAV